MIVCVDKLPKWNKMKENEKVRYDISVMLIDG